MRRPIGATSSGALRVRSSALSSSDEEPQCRASLIFSSFRQSLGSVDRRLPSCLIAGAVMACATPPMNVYPLVWVGLIALFLLLDDGPLPARPPLRDMARGGLRGLLFGLGTNLVALRFVSTVVTRFAALPGTWGLWGSS